MSSFAGICVLGGKDFSLPDSSFFWGDAPGLAPPQVWRSREAFLSHRQRVLTPEDRFERQPLNRPGGSHVMLFGGRLDDRSGLCAALGLRERSDLPDSEIAFCAVERWGIQAPEHIIGDFAFAVWQPAQRQLLMAATPFGARTLYYHLAEDRVFFASNLPTLLAIPGISHELDASCLAAFLGWDHTARSRTFFRDIRRVVPGNAIRLGQEGVKERYCFVEFPRSRPPLVLRTDEEYVEAAREVLGRAVCAQQRSIGTVPIVGGGGFDSACLAGTVAALNRGTGFRMFTMVPERGADVSAIPKGKYADESPYVLALTEAFPGSDARFVEPRRDLDWGTDAGFTQTGLPVRVAGNADWMDAIYPMVADSGASSVLNGTSGNYTLTWNGCRGLCDQFLEGRWGHLLANCIPLRDFSPRRAVGLVLNQILRPLLPLPLRREYPEVVAALTGFGRSLLPQQFIQGYDRSFFGPPSGHAERTRVLHYNSSWFVEYCRSVLIRYGIEIRMPLLDRRVIEFSLSVPVEQYICRGEERFLAKRLMRALGVPGSIVNRRERGAWTPEWYTRLGRNVPALKREIASLRRVPLAARLIDLDRLDHYLDAWPATSREAAAKRIILWEVLLRALNVGKYIHWAEKATHQR